MTTPARSPTQSWEKLRSGTTPTTGASGAPSPVSASFTPVCSDVLIQTYPYMRRPVVDGLLRTGETMNIVAAPKIGKSWMAHALAGAIVTGTPWFGLRTHQGPVLLIDAELHHETLAYRLSKMWSKLETQPHPDLHVLPVRGNLVTIQDVRAAMESHVGVYQAIVFDALYCFMPEGFDENSNANMTQIYNQLDALAKTAQSSIVVVHHASKGNQSDRSVTDLGAGAGAQSRRADTHLVIREHEEPDCAVVEAVVRTWTRMRPMGIRWTDPGWVLAPELDTSRLRGRRQPREASAAGPGLAPARTWTTEEFVNEFVGSVGKIKDDVIEDARAQGLSLREAGRIFKRAEKEKLIFRHRTRPQESPTFSTQQPAAPIETTQKPGPHKADAA